MTGTRDIVRSNRSHLMPVFAAAGVLLLVLAGIAMVIYNERSYREAKVQQIEAQSHILASTVAAALAFDDRRAAREYVIALGVDPQIRIAAVYDSRGDLFAVFSRSGEQPVPRTPKEEDSVTNGDHLVVTTPVRQGTALLGTVYMRTAIDPISRRFERYGVIGLLVAMAALIFMMLGLAQRRLSAANEQLRKQGLDLAEANENLRAQIEQREQAETALRQVQKMEAMGQLTGGVAHDFNNLLTPIIGGLDLLQRRAIGDDRAQRTIDGALASAERAKTLVQRLLAFARRQPLQPTSVDVGELVRGMADLIGSTTGPQVRVLVDVADALPPAIADANQLEMALLNLAVNARDAMPDGGSITIGAGVERIGKRHSSELSPGDYICVSVTDTGTGMDKATLKRAVEPFFSTKGLGKGTGLGLSMVHGLAAQLGGAMTISSQLGVGTRVDLWLRVAQQPAEAARSKNARGNHTATGTVLLVDDEDLVRASTAEMLADLGYAVIEASTAEEALRLVGEGLRPDLLVTDHLMPGMDGVELVRRLMQEIPTLRPLVISGYAEAEGVAPDLPRLEKPFRRADLAQLLIEDDVIV
jgi:signal transduction histidine kinase